MGFIIKDKNEVISLIQSDKGKIKDLWDSLYARTVMNTSKPGLLQPGDSQEWWHLIWERLSDAAFVQAVKPSETLRDWLRKVTLDVCGYSADAWIGPWFRQRYSPLTGTLETAHVALSISTVYDLCSDIFNESELESIREALKVKGQEPCRIYLDNILNEKDHINNWFMALLNGYGTAAAVLNDREAVLRTVEFFKTAASLYNSDSYGESVQYSNYATLHLSHLYEVLARFDREMEDKLDIGCYTRLMAWYAASMMYKKTLEGYGDGEYPRTINFGDSAATFRPSGDILIHIANRGKVKFPKKAGLAKWLFDATYSNTKLEPTGMASFGFFNTFQFFSILLYQDSAEAVPPEQAGIPLLSSFELGSYIARDNWSEPKTILGIQAGFSNHNVSSHRHKDQNSFILSHLNERFFVDPGHCCYRLRSQIFSASEANHNTWSFEYVENGKTVHVNQKEVTGNIFKPTPFMNKAGIVKELDGIHVVRSDAAEVYGGPITKAERIWIAPMPNTLFILDRIEAATPIRVQSHFILNNRDSNLKTNIAAENKLVFRRGKAAIKFFQVKSESDGVETKSKLSFDWGYVHDYYHPLPNQKCQGAEGSALVYNYTIEEYKNRHLLIYAIAMDRIEEIIYWHIKSLPGNEFHVEPPSHEGGYSLVLVDNGELEVLDKRTGKAYRISESAFYQI